jgi:hypothetical protein
VEPRVENETKKENFKPAAMASALRIESFSPENQDHAKNKSKTAYAIKVNERKPCTRELKH